MNGSTYVRVFMLKKIGKAIEGFNWLIYFSGVAALILLVLYVGDVTRRINDVSMTYCATVIAKDADLTVWEQQLRAEKAEILEREAALKSKK